MYMRTHTQTHKFTYIYIRTCTRTRIHAHTYTYAGICTLIHRYKISATTPQRLKQYHRRTYVSIYICMSIHIHMHIHICAHPAASVSRSQMCTLMSNKHLYNVFVSSAFIIAFITWNRILVPLLEGLCSSNLCRFELSVLGLSKLLESNRRPQLITQSRQRATQTTPARVYWCGTNHPIHGRSGCGPWRSCPQNRVHILAIFPPLFSVLPG